VATHAAEPGHWDCLGNLWSIDKATIPSLFLGIVLILKYYVLENITVLISEKCP